MQKQRRFTFRGTVENIEREGRRDAELTIGTTFRLGDRTEKMSFRIRSGLTAVQGRETLTKGCSAEISGLLNSVDGPEGPVNTVESLTLRPLKKNGSAPRHRRQTLWAVISQRSDDLDGSSEDMSVFHTQEEAQKHFDDVLGSDFLSDDTPFFDVDAPPESETLQRIGYLAERFDIEGDARNEFALTDGDLRMRIVIKRIEF